MKALYTIVLGAILFIISCTKSSKTSNEESKCETGEYATIMDMRGLDGCQFNIRLDKSGEMLEPTNLDSYPVFRINNKRVKLHYKELPNMASICMVGQVVEITCIKEAE